MCLDVVIMGFFIVLVNVQACRAAQVGDSKDAYFRGVMVETTPCAINDEKPITVMFGNVGISKIDTGRYVQDLHYSLNCGGATSKDKVLLFIKATPTTWDTKAIVTSVSGLGAQVLKEGASLELNSYVSILDPSNPPTLQILLVKDPHVTLTDQPFSATGTLIIEYV